MSIRSPEGFEGNAFLGENVKKPNLVSRIEGAANKLISLKVLNPRTDTEKQNQNLNAVQFVKNPDNSGVFNANSVVELRAVLDDDKKTKAQKNIARERLLVLENSVYMAMRYGGDADMQRIVESGIVSDIEKVLPKPLEGLGEGVRDKVILNKRVRAVLNILDSKTAKGKADNEVLRKGIEEALDGLSRIATSLDLDDKTYDEITMVSAYLGARKEGIVVATQSDADKIVDALARIETDRQKKEDDQARLQQEAAAEAGDRMKLKYFKAMWGFQTPDSPQVGSTLAPEWQKRLDNDVALAIIELNNSAYVLNKAPGLEEWLQYLYRAPDKVMNEYINLPGFKQLAEDMLNRYFDPVPGFDSIDYYNLRFLGQWDPPGAGPENKKRVWKIDKDVKADFTDLDALFQMYSDALINQGLIPGNSQLEKEANAAMTLGIWGSLMRVSLLTDDANPSGSYDVNNFRNQVWNTNYPEAKGLQKFAFDKDPDEQSPFADQFGDWLRMRRKSSENPDSFTHALDIQFMKDWIENGKLHPLPERLLVNYFTITKVKVVDLPPEALKLKHDDGKFLKDGDEVCLLRALREGWTIKYENMGTEKPWLTFHDVVRSAAGIFGYIGATDKAAPIVFGKTGGEWSLGLEKKFVYLRGIPELREVVRNKRIAGEDHSPWAERILWMMGACAGGFGDSPELVIAQNAQNKIEDGPQAAEVMNILRSDSMVSMLDQVDRDWIAKTVHAFYDLKSKTPQREYQKSLDQRVAIIKRAGGKSNWSRLFRVPLIG